MSFNRVTILFLAQISQRVFSQESTVFEFTRLANTCDKEGDVEIGPSGTSKVVWAYNDNDPVSENEILYHQARGTKSVNFIGQPQQPTPVEPDAEPIDVRVSNVPIADTQTGEPVDTLYYCKTFRLPSDRKKHVVRLEPLFSPGNLEYVHHILIYSCPRPVDLTWEDDCFSEDVPQPMQDCLVSTILLAWAIGGNAWNSPPVAGYPIGPGFSDFVLMEVHYDNPSLRNVIDSSGMRLWATESLRQYDAGLVDVGHHIPSIRIPPHQQDFEVVGECPGRCTTEVFGNGVKAFGVMLHAHIISTGIKFQHIRNGVELPTLDDNPNYDFDFQETLALEPERDILPGDEFVVTCTYNSMERDEDTVGGFSSREEMCEAYINYYPAIPGRPFDYCTSGNVEGEYTSFCNASSPGEPMEPLIYQPLPVVDRCEGFEPGNNSIIPVLSDLFDPLQYKNRITLDTEGKYTIYWNHDLETNEMHLAVEVQTPGWVGFGISPTGDMSSSDIYIAWVDENQNVYFRDRFAYDRLMPVVDRQQDVYDIKGLQGNILVSKEEWEKHARDFAWVFDD